MYVHSPNCFTGEALSHMGHPYYPFVRYSKPRTTSLLSTCQLEKVTSEARKKKMKTPEINFENCAIEPSSLKEKLAIDRNL
jgi:hypothetical protein